MSGPKLNRKLTLEAPVRVMDGAGGYSESWTALGELWAEIRPGTGREAERGELAVASVPLKITVRAAEPGAPSRPMPGQRFREGVRTFRILSVFEADAAARFLVCSAREEVAA